MSMIEIIAMIESFGHGELISCQYRVPGMNLQDGLRDLYTDADVTEMVQIIPSLRVVEIYLEHMTVMVQSRVGSSESGNGNDIKGKYVRDNEDESDYDSDFHDSEYVIVEDELFEANMDKSIDCAGVRDTVGVGTTTNVVGVELNDVDMNSDEEGSQNLGCCNETSDEEGSPGPKLPECKAATNMGDPPFKVGMSFRDAAEFREAVKEYAIKQGVNIKFVKNESARVRAKCSEGCEWMVFASPRKGMETFQVKTLNDKHSCGIHDKNAESTVVEAVLPPAYPNKVGRRKKMREREPSETASRAKLGRQGPPQSCGACGGVGHNQRTCKLSMGSQTSGKK